MRKIVVVDKACVWLSLPNEDEDGFGRNNARIFVTGRCACQIKRGQKRKKGRDKQKGESVFE